MGSAGREEQAGNNYFPFEYSWFREDDIIIEWLLVDKDNY